MDRPQKRMSNRKFAALAAVAIFVPCIVVVAYFYQPYTWGGTGDLSISMKLDRTEMDSNGSVNATVMLKNSGSAPVRLLNYHSKSGFQVYLVNETGGEIHYQRPPGAIQSKGTTNYNQYMKVLAPGETWTWTQRIYNDSHSWRIPANHTYQAYGQFSSTGMSQMGVLPYWTGTVKTEPIAMTVKN